MSCFVIPSTGIPVERRARYQRAPWLRLLGWSSATSTAPLSPVIPSGGVLPQRCHPERRRLGGWAGVEGPLFPGSAVIPTEGFTGAPDRRRFCACWGWEAESRDLLLICRPVHLSRNRHVGTPGGMFLLSLTGFAAGTLCTLAYLPRLALLPQQVRPRSLAAHADQPRRRAGAVGQLRTHDPLATHHLAEYCPLLLQRASADDEAALPGRHRGSRPAIWR